MSRLAEEEIQMKEDGKDVVEIGKEDQNNREGGQLSTSTEDSNVIIHQGMLSVDAEPLGGVCGTFVVSSWGSDFRQSLAKKGFNICRILEDRNSFFSAAALYLFSDAGLQNVIRTEVADYLEAYWERFVTYLPEYATSNSCYSVREGEEADFPALQAVSNIYRLRIEIMQPFNIQTIITPLEGQFTSIIYLGVANNHYNLLTHSM